MCQHTSETEFVRVGLGKHDGIAMVIACYGYIYGFNLYLVPTTVLLCIIQYHQYLVSTFQYIISHIHIYNTFQYLHLQGIYSEPNLKVSWFPHAFPTFFLLRKV